MDVMETEALERPADLAVWPAFAGDAARAVSTHYASLREALSAAAQVLADPTKQPWIVTEDGEMLAPVAIRAYLN
ncbi:hypothetical protein GCM10007887_32330 [Methylobacterium haplocladii]|uniref:Uncharacterized protein n=2 Tax=Methylobacterium haplocladii TaxID=1176176 RepID=A0A512ILG8_9HYPH|nr:hypothetical protein MHA02_09130 [Methylobacterium haplocladii]GLS60554.1 hypothetical protein GCM10007887_32330 [Methylobacterium haplocladii]